MHGKLLGWPFIKLYELRWNSSSLIAAKISDPMSSECNQKHLQVKERTGKHAKVKERKAICLAHKYQCSNVAVVPSPLLCTVLLELTDWDIWYNGLHLRRRPWSQMQNHGRHVSEVRQPGDIQQPTKIKNHENHLNTYKKYLAETDLSLPREVILQLPFCNPGW